MPKVSVLMPIYNTEAAALKQAVESILSQTFSDFEFIILNDSPENKELDSIILGYEDARIVYLKNKKNRGIEESTNILINKSQGEYIAIFDHDDISLPNRLKMEVDYLDNHPKTGLVSAQFRVFGGEKWTSSNPITSNEIKKRLLIESCVSHTACMIRRSTLEEYNIRYEKGFFPAASYRIITRLALITEVHNLPVVLLEYRMDGNNTSLKYAKQRLIARKKIQQQYLEGINTQLIKDDIRLDSIKTLNGPPYKDARRYYKGTRGGKDYFIKAGENNYEREYSFLKTVYLSNKEHFLEPVSFRSGKLNYLVMQWSVDGVNLDEYLRSRKLSEDQKKSLIQDLYSIWRTLYRLGIVHRDIIPRNFMVENDRLILIDFYWAVIFDKYSEYDHLDDIRDLSLLGEEYAAGVYRWDDAYSFSKVAEYILGQDIHENSLVNEIKQAIGIRVITPDPQMFHKTIIKQEKYNEELRTENTDLIARNEELRTENTDLIARNEELQHQAQRITGSLSWKITKLLRAIMFRLRLLRNLGHNSKP